MSDTIQEQEEKVVDGFKTCRSCKSPMLKSIHGAVCPACKKLKNRRWYGNFYAQLGQIREWLGIQDQYQREHAKRKDKEADE